jgi:hypothetical protein
MELIYFICGLGLLPLGCLVYLCIDIYRVKHSRTA